MALDLGKQVGPLPLGAWIAVVGGGLGLGFYTYRQQNKSTGSSTPTVVDNTSGQPGVGDGSVGGWQSTTPTDQSGATQTTSFTTNEQWGTACITWLIAQGYNPVTSDSAIRKYLAGGDPAPSTQEWSLISLALAHYGPPPSPLPPSESQPPDNTPPPPPTQGNGGTTTPPPPPPPNNPPAAQGGWDFITPWPSKGSTLWGQATIHYGDGNKWPTIYNANKVGVRRPDGSMGMISNPNLVYTGWKLWIPAA